MIERFSTQMFLPSTRERVTITGYRSTDPHRDRAPALTVLMSLGLAGRSLTRLEVTEIEDLLALR